MSGAREGDSLSAASRPAAHGADIRLTAAFLDGFVGGGRLCVRFEPAARKPRGTVLCLQAIGEEAWVSRRVMATQAQRMAARGWNTWILDLYGTGDSAGRWEDASLAAWRADLLRASRLAREACPGPFVLWGLRMGALLAADVAVAQDQLAAAIVLWEPVIAGTEGGAGPTACTDGSPALLRDLGELTLQPPALGAHAEPCPVLFVGIEPEHVSGAPPPAALSSAAEQWLAEGYLASLQMTRGLRFWEPQRRLPEDSSRGFAAPPMPEALFAITEAFLDCLQPGDVHERIR